MKKLLATIMLLTMPTAVYADGPGSPWDRPEVDNPVRCYIPILNIAIRCGSLGAVQPDDGDDTPTTISRPEPQPEPEVSRPEPQPEQICD